MSFNISQIINALKVKGKNVANDNNVDEVSYALDENGYPVLRTVNVSPFAYDETSQAYKVLVQNNPSNTNKTTLLTVADNSSNIGASQSYFGNGGLLTGTTPFPISDYLDLSTTNEIALIIKSTYDQPVTMIFYTTNSGGAAMFRLEDNGYSIPANTDWLVLTKEQYSVLDIPFSKLVIRILSGTTQPSSGSITFEVVGR